MRCARQAHSALLCSALLCSAHRHRVWHSNHFVYINIFPFLSFNVAFFSFNGIPFFVSFFHSFLLLLGISRLLLLFLSFFLSFFLCALRVRVYRHYFNILLLCPLVAIIHRRSSFVDTTKTKHFNFVLTTKLVENSSSSSSSNARRDRSSYGYELVECS